MRQPRRFGRELHERPGLRGAPWGHRCGGGTQRRRLRHRLHQPHDLPFLRRSTPDRSSRPVRQQRRRQRQCADIPGTSTTSPVRASPSPTEQTVHTGRGRRLALLRLCLRGRSSYDGCVGGDALGRDRAQTCTARARRLANMNSMAVESEQRGIRRAQTANVSHFFSRCRRAGCRLSTAASATTSCGRHLRGASRCTGAPLSPSPTSPWHPRGQSTRPRRSASTWPTSSPPPRGRSSSTATSATNGSGGICADIPGAGAPLHATRQRPRRRVRTAHSLYAAGQNTVVRVHARAGQADHLPGVLRQ